MRSESELRTAISRSREEGFRLLFQQYSGYVYAIVWNRICTVGTREDAEECVSDIFSDVFANFDRIGNGKLQSYIRTVTKRTAIDKFRSLSAQPDMVSIEEQELQDALSEENVEQDYETIALRRLLLDQIHALGEPDATIIMMKYFYERTSNEIAAVVHLNPVAVRMRASRAMKKLKKLLSDNNITP
ncbi:MAG: sigma-70 family RNA polymerase sigma factor [Oscillospiraceae bacterium]|nr:sigma-70 family RNA polymerase sigma factor [Oscillospiraceae bacterium]